ncbi:outer membrane beta-barrel protein [Pontibacter russatus]|uniref:outer membrane beta-barrel protein n=1 Tax=Pontibacter russatus TaxID=2694929 RepID=UPI00137B1CEE|nr:outer membrane beta-barrel protein [Pontibacter russatus]
MSSAANDKRGKLEEEFRNRMYDAEASPSQQLWVRIDHRLTVQENGEYKKRAIYYRQLAAACIVLLLLVGGAGAYYFGGAPAAQQPLSTVSPASPAPAAPGQQNNNPAQTEAAIAAAETATEQEPTAEGGPDDASSQAAGRAVRAVAAAEAGSETGTDTSIGYIEAAPGNGAATENPIALTTPATAGGSESVTGTRPLSIYKSIRNTIAAMSEAAEAPAFPIRGVTRQSFSSPAATQQPVADGFVKQNEQVMARARQQEEARKALAIARSETAAADAKKSKKEDREESGRWSLGMAYAPSYFDQNIGMSNPMMGASSRQTFMAGGPATALSSLYMDQASEEYDENSDMGFSYGVEMKTSFRLGKKLKLLTGLGFLQNTSRSKSSYVVQQFWGNAYADAYSSSGPSSIFLPSISRSSGTDSLMVARAPEYKVNHRYRYLTVPVGLQYEGNMGKDWFWYGGAGVAANILLQTTILASASDVSDVEYDVNENSPFRKLQWSGNLSAGVGKRLASHISVTLGPEFRSYFATLLADPENTQAPQGRPYTVGVNMAVNYELGSGKKDR